MKLEEYEILSSRQTIVTERKHHEKLGKYGDSITHSITHSMTLQSKKITYFNAYIWGLYKE